MSRSSDIKMSRVRWHEDLVLDEREQASPHLVPVSREFPDDAHGARPGARSSRTQCPHRTSIFDPRFRFLIDLIAPNILIDDASTETCLRCSMRESNDLANEPNILRITAQQLDLRGGRFGHPLRGQQSLQPTLYRTSSDGKPSRTWGR